MVKGENTQNIRTQSPQKNQPQQNVPEERGNEKKIKEILGVSELKYKHTSLSSGNKDNKLKKLIKIEAKKNKDTLDSLQSLLLYFKKLQSIDLNEDITEASLEELISALKAINTELPFVKQRIKEEFMISQEFLDKSELLLGYISTLTELAKEAKKLMDKDLPLNLMAVNLERADAYKKSIFRLLKDKDLDQGFKSLEQQLNQQIKDAEK